MTKQTQTILFIAGGILLLLTVGAVTYLSVLRPFLQTWEGFSAVPYWDVSRWSWGYGTEVPGSVPDRSVNPGGTITEPDAFAAAQAHITHDYNYLKPLLTVPLNSNQWAALLSFSYNLGPGNADNLIPNINSGDMVSLGTQWNEYVYAGGLIDPDLERRRAAEWQLFNS